MKLTSKFLGCAALLTFVACYHRDYAMRLLFPTEEDAREILRSAPFPSPTPQLLPEFDDRGNLLLAGGINEVATSGLTDEQAKAKLSPGCYASWTRLPVNSAVICWPNGYPVRAFWDPEEQR